MGEGEGKERAREGIQLHGSELHVFGVPGSLTKGLGKDS